MSLHAKFRKSHVNVKFLSVTGTLTACHVSLNKELLCNVKFLNSIGNLTTCHVSLTIQAGNLTHQIFGRGDVQTHEISKKCHNL